MRKESTQLSSGMDELGSILSELLIGDIAIRQDDSGSPAWIFTIDFRKGMEKSPDSPRCR